MAAEASERRQEALIQDDDEMVTMKWLCEAFPSMGLEEIASAYKSAGCNASKATDILAGLQNYSIPQSSILLPSRKTNDGAIHSQASRKGKSKPKSRKISISTGSVTGFIGNACARKTNNANNRAWDARTDETALTNGHSSFVGMDSSENEVSSLEIHVDKKSGDEKTEFCLNSMTGDGLEEIKDVSGECGHDVEFKDLNRLVDFATNSKPPLEEAPTMKIGDNLSSEKELLIEISFQALSEAFPGKDQEAILKACEVADGDIESALSIILSTDDLLGREDETESAKNSALEKLKRDFPTFSLSKLYEKLESAKFSYSEESRSFQGDHDEKLRHSEQQKTNLLRDVLDSLFTPSERREKPTKAAELVSSLRIRRKKDKTIMNTSISEQCQMEKEVPLHIDLRNDEYTHFRKIATENWETMKSYYGEAAAAFTKGEHKRATYLQEQGNYYKRIAREAEDNASKKLFKTRAVHPENDITLDLHMQDGEASVHLLKFQIQALVYDSSIRSLKVLIGDGKGRGKTKRSVTKFLEKEGIKWTEENGIIMIKVEDINFEGLSFQCSDSD